MSETQPPTPSLAVSYAFLGWLPDYWMADDDHPCQDGLGFISAHSWPMEPEDARVARGILEDEHVPIGVLAIPLGKTAYFWLYDPCDSLIREALAERREANSLSLLFRGSDDVHAYLQVQVPVLSQTLDRTDGLAADEPHVWMHYAKELAKEIPNKYPTIGHAGDFQKYSVQIVIPDDVDHPMYKLVARTAVLRQKIF